jgi:hypothetical protein
MSERTITVVNITLRGERDVVERDVIRLRARAKSLPTYDGELTDSDPEREFRDISGGTR